MSSRLAKLAFAIEIAVMESYLSMDLCLRSFGFRVAQFGYEGRRVSALTPCLGEIRTDRTRRAADLIGERKSFIPWKMLR